MGQSASDRSDPGDSENERWQPFCASWDARTTKTSRTSTLSSIGRAWSRRALSRILVGLLVSLFVAENEPLVIGIDETIERRRGSKIAARGIYRDAVRSSKEFLVKTSGLRWISMLLDASDPL